ncbi:hypothetical protein EVAR_96361_1 [Eumeta japonica]|uniref:Uncharacterized protein n=1 Tax=Eumeta variegata TaxID=151549 RepID=A0A4C1VXX0_EUMVA|nr:hypothetical protein EVAR_96361_1 [Eumeta japonica]
MATHKRSQNITGNKEPVPVISDITNKIMDIIGLASTVGIGPMESIIDIGPSEQDTAVSLPMEPHSSGHSSTMNPAPASLEQIPNIPTLGVKKMIKRRKQYRSVADFANIQRKTNEILKKFADDVEGVLKERNEIEKERNAILRNYKVMSGRRRRSNIGRSSVNAKRVRSQRDEESSTEREARLSQLRDRYRAERERIFNRA